MQIRMMVIENYQSYIKIINYSSFLLIILNTNKRFKYFNQSIISVLFEFFSYLKNISILFHGIEVIE